MRSSGILMHITSLPGPYGVGTMGKQAFAFVDFLKQAGLYVVADFLPLLGEADAYGAAIFRVRVALEEPLVHHRLYQRTSPDTRTGRRVGEEWTESYHRVD